MCKMWDWQVFPWWKWRHFREYRYPITTRVASLHQLAGHFQRWLRRQLCGITIVERWASCHGADARYLWDPTIFYRHALGRVRVAQMDTRAPHGSKWRLLLLLRSPLTYLCLWPLNPSLWMLQYLSLSLPSICDLRRQAQGVWRKTICKYSPVHFKFTYTFVYSIFTCSSLSSRSVQNMKETCGGSRSARC